MPTKNDQNVNWYKTVSQYVNRSWYNSIKMELIRGNKASLIAEALSTPEGLAAFAQAMVQPIRNALNYQSIGRKLLMVQELPQGAYATYQSS